MGIIEVVNADKLTFKDRAYYVNEFVERNSSSTKCVFCKSVCSNVDEAEKKGEVAYCAQCYDQTNRVVKQYFEELTRKQYHLQEEREPDTDVLSESRQEWVFYVSLCPELSAIRLNST